MQPPAPATLAVATGGGESSASPPRPLSHASPLGRSQGTRGSVESSAWGGSSWDPSVSGTGARSVASSSARPSFRTLSASSTVEHDHDGYDRRGGEGRHGNDRLESSTEGRPGDDCFSPLGSPASAAFAGIANADAAADASVLASPAPGRKSKLFRRVSRLPRASLEEFDQQDGGVGGDDDGNGIEGGKHATGDGGEGGTLNGDTENAGIRRTDSGVSSAGSGGGNCDNGGGSGGSGGVGSRQFSGSGDEGGGSTDTSSIGRKGGLGKGFGGGTPRAHGRRDAVLQEMRPEPRGRGNGRDKDKDRGGARLGGVGGASRSESAKERRRGKGDTSGDTGRGAGVRSDELQLRQQARAKHRLYPNSGELRVVLSATVAAAVVVVFSFSLRFCFGLVVRVLCV